MSKVVTIRFTNGDTEKVVLGEEKTCVSAQPRGWGTECETLVFKEDGYYHCDDCGLVFKKPIGKGITEPALVVCDCNKLVNFLEWFSDECHGYDCPSSHYRCDKCGRIYQSPHYSREAPIRLQESEAAKKHVQNHRDYQKQERAERSDRALEDARELKEILKQVSKAVRQKILRELTA